MLLLLKSWSFFKVSIAKITCHNCLHRYPLAVREARYNVISTSLHPNAPAFQHFQLQMAIMVPPLAPQNTYWTTCNVSANTPMNVLLQIAIASVNGINCRLLFEIGSQLWKKNTIA